MTGSLLKRDMEVESPASELRLFGVADALSEKTGAGVAWSILRSLNERDLAITREMLDLEAFEAAWGEGRTMTLEQAVEYALEDDEASPE